MRGARSRKAAALLLSGSPCEQEEGEPGASGCPRADCKAIGEISWFGGKWR